MTDYIAKGGDRVLVFGASSMFEYRFRVDQDGNEMLDLFHIWQAKYISERQKDRLRRRMKNTTASQTPKGNTVGEDFIVIKGDRVFVFGLRKMFEYRWNVDTNGNELLDLFRFWRGKIIGEKLKDALRQTIKEKNG